MVQRAWWKLKLWVWPWADRCNAPEPMPRMRVAEDMLSTAIFNLADVLDDKRRQ